jgi:hypothetical protein
MSLRVRRRRQVTAKRKRYLNRRRDGRPTVEIVECAPISLHPNLVGGISCFAEKRLPHVVAPEGGLPFRPPSGQPIIYYDDTLMRKLSCCGMGKPSPSTRTCL